MVSSSTGKPPLSADDLARYPSTISYLEVHSGLKSLFPATLQDLQYLSYARIKSELNNKGTDVL